MPTNVRNRCKDQACDSRLKVVVFLATVALLLTTGCVSNYRIEQAKKLSKVLGNTQTLLTSQYVDALMAYRTQHFLNAADNWSNLDQAAREERFMAMICDHNAYEINLAQVALGSQSQVLERAAAGATDTGIGATLKALAAKAESIAPPGSVGPPAAECRKIVEADLRDSRTRGLAVVTAGVGAIGKLLDVFQAALEAIEKQSRGDRLVDMLKEDEGAIWATYYLLACPRAISKEKVPQGRPAITSDSPLGCGSDTGAYQTMLDETRVHFSRVSYSAFETAMEGKPSLTEVKEFLAELGRYDQYRLASVHEPTAAGLVVNLQSSLAKLIDAVLAGPSSQGDMLQAAVDGVDNLEALLKAWNDYKSAYADYKSK